MLRYVGWASINITYAAQFILLSAFAIAEGVAVRSLVFKYS